LYLNGRDWTVNAVWGPQPKPVTVENLRLQYNAYFFLWFMTTCWRRGWQWEARDHLTLVLRLSGCSIRGVLLLGRLGLTNTAYHRYETEMAVREALRFACLPQVY
jgi:hypothetical protein